MRTHYYFPDGVHAVEHRDLDYLDAKDELSELDFEVLKDQLSTNCDTCAFEKPVVSRIVAWIRKSDIDLPQMDDHPSDEDIYLFAQEGTEPEHRMPMAVHIARCGSCYERYGVKQAEWDAIIGPEIEKAWQVYCDNILKK
ncbi:hypothetical protein JW758_05510 [Candidatus Peregrinibacteria bacterium]|nr:hypothetical protein [Candidatus Peregrinibacteria bacterium]